MKKGENGGQKAFNRDGLENGREKMFYEHYWYSFCQGGGFGGHQTAYGGWAVFFQGNMIYAKGRHIGKWVSSKTAHISCSRAIEGLTSCKRNMGDGH